MPVFDPDASGAADQAAQQMKDDEGAATRSERAALRAHNPLLAAAYDVRDAANALLHQAVAADSAAGRLLAVEADYTRLGTDLVQSAVATAETIRALQDRDADAGLYATPDNRVARLFATLSVAEAAHALGVSPRRVQVLISTKRLPAVKEGRDYRINPRHLTLVRDRRPGRPRKTATPS